VEVVGGVVVVVLVGAGATIACTSTTASSEADTSGPSTTRPSGPGRIGVPVATTVLVVVSLRLVVQLKIHSSSGPVSNRSTGPVSRSFSSMSPSTYTTGAQRSSTIRAATSASGTLPVLVTA